MKDRQSVPNAERPAPNRVQPGIVPPALGLVLLLTGCARYEYDIVEPPAWASHVGEKSGVSLRDDIEYRLVSSDDRLVMHIYNRGAAVVRAEKRYGRTGDRRSTGHLPARYYSSLDGQRGNGPAGQSRARIQCFQQFDQSTDSLCRQTSRRSAKHAASG